MLRVRVDGQMFALNLFHGRIGPHAEHTQIDLCLDVLRIRSAIENLQQNPLWRRLLRTEGNEHRE